MMASSAIVDKKREYSKVDREFLRVINTEAVLFVVIFSLAWWVWVHYAIIWVEYPLPQIPGVSTGNRVAVLFRINATIASVIVFAWGLSLLIFADLIRRLYIYWRMWRRIR